MNNIKIIEGTNNMYTVSDNGKIYYKGEEVEYKIQPNGYCSVKIKLNIGTRYFLVHKIVAHYFINNDSPDIKTQVNHKDGNKQNNTVNNLEWVSNTENQRHRIDILKKDCKGSNNPMYGKSGSKSPVYKGVILQYDKQYNLIAKHEGSGNAAKYIGGTPSNVIRVINKPRTYKGYYFIRQVGLKPRELMETLKKRDNHDPSLNEEGATTIESIG